MKAIITVIGNDKVGIIAGVSGLMARYNANILDINQTVFGTNFIMAMYVDLTDIIVSYKELKDKLDELGKNMDLNVRIQREEIFNAMNRI